MTSTHHVSRARVWSCLIVLAIPTAVFAQRGAIGGLLTNPPVVGVPLSATATTTVRQTLRDGSRIERTGIAHYYRDRMGRVRVEQTIQGNQALHSADGRVRITIQPDPSQKVVFTLDPATRTANRHPPELSQSAVGGGDTFALPLGGPPWRFLVFSRGEHLRGLGAAGREDSLGFRRIDGVAAVGRRVTMTIPIGIFGNDRPFDIVDERWESRDLMLLMYGHSSDPRTGVIEYRLTNIRLAEPPSDLFVVPPDFTIASTGDNGWTSLEFAERQDMSVTLRTRNR